MAKKRTKSAKNDRIEVRANSAEKQAFGQAAELAGMSTSGWVRDRLRTCARQELEIAGQAVPFLPSTAVDRK